jgi:hypothetical protein
MQEGLACGDRRARADLGMQLVPSVGDGPAQRP